MQIAYIAGALLIAYFFLVDFQTSITWILVTATAFCLLWQLWWILPYTALWPKEVKTGSNDDPDRQFGIITANVLKTNRHSETLIGLVREHQPDILITLESDNWWQDKLDVLESDMPYSVKCPLDNLYGMHLYSRLPLSKQEVKYLVEEGVPSIHVSVELSTGDKVGMHFLHPAPPSPTENTESAERDAELIAVAKSISETDQPVVVTGDLNDVAWSNTTRLFRKISGLLDPRVGRGIFSTFHADYPFLRWPLDHLFHSSHFTLKSIQRLPPIGSDHFALFTVLMFTPIQGSDQGGLEASSKDHDKAQEAANKKQIDANDIPKLDE